jgi:DNA-binding SARP family transcriptional activator
MRFQLLGPLTVWHQNTPLPLGPAKQRSLLAALLLEPDRVVAMDRLVLALWDGTPPPSAVSNVRTYASRLRRLLADVDADAAARARRDAHPDGPGHHDGPGHPAARVIGRSPGYQVSVADGELDLALFRELARTGHAALAAGQNARAARAFEEALALWQGDAAEDVYRSALLDRVLGSLDEQRLAVTEGWITARQRLGEDAELIDELRRLSSDHPLRERLWCQLMLSLYRVGDIGGALAAYRLARATLAESLGVDPGPELVRLHQAVLARDPALGGTVPYPLAQAAAPAPARPAPAPVAVPQPWAATPRELPADASVLVGRDEELAQVVEAVLEQRTGCDTATGCGPAVVALHGQPGVGKSALAVRAATQLIDDYPDGQLYADLCGTGEGAQPRTPVELLGCFLRALGVPGSQVPTREHEASARFRTIVADRRILVLLDNALDESQVRPLLTATRGSAVIVTSRRILATLDGAVHVEPGVLDRADSVELLERLCGPGDRHRRTSEPGQLLRLADLCGGLPLALRIVAARLSRTPGLPPDTLAEQLADERSRLGGISCGDLIVRSLPNPQAARGTG